MRSCAWRGCSPSLGVRKLRLTGGEPLLRANLADLVGDLSAIPDIEDIALTTNGVLLGTACGRSARQRPEARHREPGHARPGDLHAHERRIRRARSGARGHRRRARRRALSPVKINAVIERGVNDHTALDLVEHFRGMPVIVRFIEFMDVGNRNAWRPDMVVPSRELADAHPRALADAPGLGELPRRSRQALALRRRRRRDRLHFLGHPAFLRRLQPRAACPRRASSTPACSRRTVSTCARPCAPGRPMRSLMDMIRGTWLARTDRYSEQREQLRRTQDPAAEKKIEMYYIGG